MKRPLSPFPLIAFFAGLVLGALAVGYEEGSAAKYLAYLKTQKTELVQPRHVYGAVNNCHPFGWNKVDKAEPAFFNCEAGGYVPRDLMELRAERLYAKIVRDLRRAGCVPRADEQQESGRSGRFTCQNPVPQSLLEEPPIVYQDDDLELAPEQCKPVAWPFFKQDGGQPGQAAQEPVLLACGQKLAPQYLTPLQLEQALAEAKEGLGHQNAMPRLPRVAPSGINLPLPPEPDEKALKAIAEAL